MNSFLRSLIVWLVLLAVPYQGFASAAMAGCAHALPMPIPPAAEQVQVRNCHGAHHGPAAHDRMQSDAQQRSGLHRGQHHDSGKCSACSACSIGAAIAPGPLAVLTPHAAPALSVPFAAGHLPSVDLALPERPPRPRSA